MEDGAVEALLCLEEVSVDVALVVLDAPLPLRRCQRLGAWLIFIFFQTDRPNGSRATHSLASHTEGGGDVIREKLTCCHF